MKLRTRLVYRFNKILRHLIKLNILSTDKSIDYLIDNKCSLARYGDGELNIIMGGDIHFQKYNEKLAKRLKELLCDKNAKIMIGIPLAINSTSGYKKEAKDFWNMNMSTGRMHWIKFCHKKSCYLNASITRCYIDYEDKKKSVRWFEKFLGIWNDLNILIVEGGSSKLGVNNSLFSNAKSIRRIICPSENAFEAYDEILETTKKIDDKVDLILVSLGPTATLLAHDLDELGYRCIDIGHLNLEFNKYLEDLGIHENKKLDISMEAYDKQIIGNVGLSS